MSLWKASFVVPYAVSENFSNALEEAFAPEALAVSTSETNPGSGPLVKTASDWNEVEAHGLWTVEALYADEPHIELLRGILEPVEDMTGATPVEFSIAPVMDVDWVTRSLEGLDPVRAGRFFVYGSHDADKIPAGVIPLLVDAGQAFGTGHHETTTGCLEFISEILRPGARLNALDIGTGTGVLAVAIAKIARCNVLASDIDPVAVGVARANARKNGVAPFVSAVTAKGFGHPALRARAPYDLIVANILARPLVALAPAFGEHLKAGGTLILSGILRSQEAMVASALRSHGLFLHSRKPKGDWVTLRIQG
ncbi:MAG: 50S ribosomal protein L11 methyltransferase [Parvibaculum sp.]|uniref:50S ribosomal protein L11 methyltransferase n=1 Tax=Parvibaculum sp. TaxID=2024848 RepID=UPI0025F9409F|nr:50S ribosomal protein L11 methyltransferase [Parvibaculum sp.]MCE9650844.1 50S ribosomal protein L11 methyltransferase [Parvibaculum sp.]